jgi:hypothetical protein
MTDHVVVIYTRAFLVSLEEVSRITVVKGPEFSLRGDLAKLVLESP